MEKIEIFTDKNLEKKKLQEFFLETTRKLENS